MPNNDSKQEKTRNIYDDGNIPEIDLLNKTETTKPLPESKRPRKDQPDRD